MTWSAFGATANPFLSAISLTDKMKKKSIIVLSVALALVLLICGIWFLSQSGKVSTASFEKGRAVFGNDDMEIARGLSDQDLDTLKVLFDGKKLYKDQPSCGFSEKVAVVFDNTETFCFAHDGSSIVYYQNKDKYFTLSDKDAQTLYTLLEQYGFEFPCV